MFKTNLRYIKYPCLRLYLRQLQNWIIFAMSALIEPPTIQGPTQLLRRQRL